MREKNLSASLAAATGAETELLGEAATGATAAASGDVTAAALM